MKKFLSIVTALVIVVGIGASIVLPTSAASTAPFGGRGHHRGMGHQRFSSTEDRQQYLEEREAWREERLALREERIKEFEKYVDDLVKDGTLTKKEGEAYKTDATRMREFCIEKGYITEDAANYGYGHHGQGRGIGCHRNW